MGITAIITAFVASHVGGMAAGGVLGRLGLFGFKQAVELTLAARARRRLEEMERARKDLTAWLAKHEQGGGPQTKP